MDEYERMKKQKEEILAKQKPKYPSQPWIDAADLRWQSDWNGHEVGLDGIAVVGLYQWRDTNVYVYIDTATNEIVDMHEESRE